MDRILQNAIYYLLGSSLGFSQVRSAWLKVSLSWGMLKLTGIPCMLPELELDMVLMSAWASTQNTTVSCHQPGLVFTSLTTTIE